MRKILHVDLDAYYAQIEQRDDPTLLGKPIAVGKDGTRGVVTTASYDARRFVVGSAMPVATAKRLCPQLMVVPIRMEVYRRESQKIREVFARYTDLIEPLSLDEAYLNVTEPKQGPPSGTLLAQHIRADIMDAVGLTASVGISYCKFLAKLGSGMNKPNGMTVITPDDAQRLIPTLPIDAFFGVGPKTAARLNELGVHTGKELRAQTLEFLETRFGKHGRYLFDIARGVDEREVNPNRLRKSIGAETTFERDITSQDALLAELPPITEMLVKRLARAGVEAGNVIVKVKTPAFELITRRMPLPQPTGEAAVISRVAARIIASKLDPVQGARLLGLQTDQLIPVGTRRVYAVPLFADLD
ncbi:MAG: DNA polymerase IV [uncultured Chloroflexia bacterium]|uniref:DNA polymerase IV n=1 Tax=uncultured Chloroflexia bacterium TaxID=1672391 RepID=A0A6J4KP83_9CHLR|nr:MAG: DNA polymerase IV [uncultured Chloroflexia bacterium]